MTPPKNPRKNFPLLWQVYHYIESHPEEWNQTFWGKRTPCGTALCFAGHATVISRPNARQIWGAYDAIESGETVDVFDGIITGSRYFIVRDWAQRVLGLTEREGSQLFSWANTLADIHRIITVWETQAIITVWETQANKVDA